MALLENEKLFKEFHSSIRDKYPELTYAQVEAIVKAPFRYIKTMMERDDMPTILVKYLGKFRVFSSKIKTLINQNDKSLKFGSITPEVHQERNEKYQSRLKEVLADELEDCDNEDN